MHRLVISAPFGNYLKFHRTTPTWGSYTVMPRGGFWRRVWKVLTTVRYDPATGAWYNRLGLPNPGLGAVRRVPAGVILSLYGFARLEWVVMLERAWDVGARVVELNLSCPNVAYSWESPPSRADLAGFPGTVIAKLSPVGYRKVGEALYARGVRHFHLCNTMPAGDRGGQSGKPLTRYALDAVRWFRTMPGVELIGGGGVTGLDDVKRFVDAGADRVSVGSMLFNPLNWFKIRGFVDYLDGGR